MRCINAQREVFDLTVRIREKIEVAAAHHEDLAEAARTSLEELYTAWPLPSTGFATTESAWASRHTSARLFCFGSCRRIRIKWYAPTSKLWSSLKGAIDLRNKLDVSDSTGIAWLASCDNVVQSLKMFIDSHNSFAKDFPLMAQDIDDVLPDLFEPVGIVPNLSQYCLPQLHDGDGPPGSINDQGDMRRRQLKQLITKLNSLLDNAPLSHECQKAFVDSSRKCLERELAKQRETVGGALRDVVG